MKIALYILLALLLVGGIVALVNYLRQRRAQQRAEREGLVLYASVLSAEPVGGLLKTLNIHNIRLSIVEPKEAPREVTLRTRLPAGQKIGTNQRLIVIIDPVKPDRIYPATPEAAKRVTFTGSRTEQKLMKAQLRNPRRFHQRTQTGYMPPPNKIR